MTTYGGLLANWVNAFCKTEHPALHGAHEVVSPRLVTLLRMLFPVQAVAAMGVAKSGDGPQCRAVIAECGTGK